MHFTHTLTRLYNIPLLMEEGYLNVVTNNVTLKLLAGEKPASLEEKVDSKAENALNVKNKIAVIPVKGTLVSHNGAGDSGVRSYEAIASDIKVALNNSIDTLVFAIKSNGGEAHGNFGLTKYISELPRKYGIQTIAIVDGPCCSGGYTIASACQQIWVTPSSVVGSIGVIATLIDESKADEKEGMSYTFVRSHSEKALLTGKEPITSSIVEKVKKDVDAMAAIMVRTIVESRPSISETVISTLNGRTVLGEEAVAIGLADKLVESFDLSLEDLVSSSVPISNNNNSVITNKVNKMTLEEALQENISLRASLDATKVNENTAISAALASERLRISTIFSQGTTFGISTDTCLKMVNKGTSAEDTLMIFESIAEARGEANPSPKSEEHPTVHKHLDVSVDTKEKTSELQNMLRGFEALASGEYSVFNRMPG